MQKQVKTIQATLLSLGLAAISLLPLPGRADGFQVIGPGGGGAMYNATISPHDTNEVLVSCDMTGAYISHDGGYTWRMFNLRGTVKFFAFDPIQPHTLYAATEALWRSTDDGKSWNLVWPRPSTVHGVRMESDHADETILANPNPIGTIDALAIDPSDSRTLIAAATKDKHSALFISTSNGDAWTRLTILPEPPRKIWIDPRSAKNNRDLYIGAAHGVTVGHNGKWQYRPSPTNVVFNDITAGFPASNRPSLYATSEAGIFVSQDGGSSWIASLLPGKGAKVRAIATSLHHPESAMVSYSDLRLSGSTWRGVARTSDSGRSWSLVWKESRDAAPNVHDAWITEQLGVDWPENPLELTVADQDPNLSYATDLGRTMATTDGGNTWTARYSKRIPGADWASTGLDVTNSYGYLVDPFDSNRRFLPSTDIGLFRSEDRGRSWTRSVTGAPRQWTNTTYWITFDPAVRGRMWAVMSNNHDLPRPKMWRHTDPLNYKGGVCISDDGGRTWKPSNTGMPETAPTHILLDPSSPAGKRILWVAAMGRGIYKSYDDGHTWALKNRGITQKNPLAWRLVRASDGTLYALIARRSEDGNIGNPGDGALYTSTDGAESWLPVSLPAGVNAPNGLAIDPHDPHRLYLATWARALGDHGEGGGIYLSTDAGHTWKNLLNRDQHIYDVTFDPRNAQILYASGFESSAWRSSDRGEHWSRIPGFNFKWGHRVAPDPDDPRMIFITTYGGGVWHGSATGAPSQSDIATPVLSPGH